MGVVASDSRRGLVALWFRVLPSDHDLGCLDDASLAGGESLCAIEFFSGIGGFSAAAGRRVRVIAAFDQGAEANAVYRWNHGLVPCPRNLDSLSPDAVPPADLWWMSPPCTPYSRRGRQRDLDDPRSASLVHLVTCCLPACLPTWFLLENVEGFMGSRAHELVLRVLGELGYQTEQAVLCPTQFGIPMKRPRLFLAASRDAPVADLAIPQRSPSPPLRAIRDFLDPEPEAAAELELPSGVIVRYGAALNCIDPADPRAVAICFTRHYGKSMKAAGSMVRMSGSRSDGSFRLRRFSPREMLRLFSFPEAFAFPSEPVLPLSARWRLVGNSVSVACVRHVLGRVLGKPAAS